MLQKLIRAKFGNQVREKWYFQIIIRKARTWVRRKDDTEKSGKWQKVWQRSILEKERIKNHLGIYWEYGIKWEGGARVNERCLKLVKKR